jgi:hypothetical protein
VVDVAEGNAALVRLRKNNLYHCHLLLFGGVYVNMLEGIVDPEL